MINLKNIKFPRLSFPGEWKEKIKGKTAALRGNTTVKVQSDEMMSLSSKIRVRWSRERLRTVALICAGVVLLGTAFIYSQIRVFHHYRILSSVERSDDSATSYVRLGSRTLKCNPNGVTCVNDANEVQWNVTFTMQSPILDTCESVVAVGDQQGQNVYVFDRNGQIGHFEAEHELLKLRVASQGVVAAVLEDGEITWINVYDAQGNVIVRTRTSMSESGYPLDVDLSSDGKKMAVSYLTMDNKNIRTKVAFYNFSSVGQSQSDYLVSSAEYEGTIVPQVSFLEGNYAVAFRDDGLTFFGGRQVPEQRAEVLFEQEIISAFQSDEYVGIITASDEEEMKHKYKLQVFRANGSRCGTQYFDMDYTNVHLDGKEIVMHGSHEVEIYSVGGKKEASLEYEKQIFDMIKLNGFRRYEVVTQDSTDRIRLK